MNILKTRSRRLKPKKPAKNPAHLALIAALPCVICGSRPVECHHPRKGVGMARKAPDEDAIPLCHRCHRTGGYGIAIHAGQKAFEAKFGTEIELLEKVRKLLGGI